MLTYLYRAFDRHNQLLYAGIAEDWQRRLREHAASKYWWCDVDRVTTMAFESREAAQWAEWAVISTCHPTYNKAIGPPRQAGASPPAAMRTSTPTFVREPFDLPCRSTPPPANDITGLVGDMRERALLIVQAVIREWAPNCVPTGVISSRLSSVGIEASRVTVLDLAVEASRQWIDSPTLDAAEGLVG